MPIGTPPAGFRQGKDSPSPVAMQTEEFVMAFHNRQTFMALSVGTSSRETMNTIPSASAGNKSKTAGYAVFGRFAAI
jgi:hypothetical protein